MCAQVAAGTAEGRVAEVTSQLEREEARRATLTHMHSRLKEEVKVRFYPRSFPDIARRNNLSHTTCFADFWGQCDDDE